MRVFVSLVALLVSLPLRAAELPAPELRFEAGTVLAGGHVLGETVILAARPGPVTLKLRDGADLHWRVTVEQGETRLLQPDGRWAAKAEYHRGSRNGRPACLVYQTLISPEWAVRGGARQQAGPDFTPADDRIYAFRDTPCP